MLLYDALCLTVLTDAGCQVGGIRTVDPDSLNPWIGIRIRIQHFKWIRIQGFDE
jgi:hypothetical protein